MTTLSEDMIRIYSASFNEHGDDPKGFLHNDQDSQFERFLMMARLFEHETKPFTVHEIGCSTGHFGQYLCNHYPLAVYSGTDIYQPFVDVCQKKFPSGNFFVRDVIKDPPTERYDYVVCCIFNLPGNTPRDQWQQFIWSMLQAMYSMADRGVSTTFLTTYYDPGRNRPDLHYQDEKEVMDFAVRNLSRHFVLDAIGPLYEYALRVYRPTYIHSLYPQQAFAKYFKPK
jgi:hypothetical protein